MNRSLQTAGSSSPGGSMSAQTEGVTLCAPLVTAPVWVALPGPRATSTGRPLLPLHSTVIFVACRSIGFKWGRLASLEALYKPLGGAPAPGGIDRKPA